MRRLGSLRLALALAGTLAACSSTSASKPVGYVATDLGPAQGVPGGWADSASVYLNSRGEVGANVGGVPSVFHDNAWHPATTVGAVDPAARMIGFNDARQIAVVVGFHTYFIDAAGTVKEIVPPLMPGYGDTATGGAMSPDGTVAGWFDITFTSISRTLFTWKDGVFTDHGQGVEVFGINDAGAIVAAQGAQGVSTTSILVLPDAERITLTAGLAPSACNASGLVGGEVGIRARYPVLLDHGTMIPLNGPHPDPNNDSTYAIHDAGWVTALNDAGDAVGMIDDSDLHPFVVQRGGEIESLASLFPQPAGATPVAINNRGEILVSYTDATSNLLRLYLLSPDGLAPPTPFLGTKPPANDRDVR